MTLLPSQAFRSFPVFFLTENVFLRAKGNMRGDVRIPLHKVLKKKLISTEE